MLDLFKKQELKICANCVYCIEDPKTIPDAQKYEYATCSHPDLVEVNLVSGKINYLYCESLRTYKCGKKGKYYKSK